MPFLPVHPHVRGVYVVVDGVEPLEMRFIPTCVGFIMKTALDKANVPVHPHVRGVYA